MPFNSTLDVLVNNADITVLGPPTSIEIEVDRGAKGDRGTKTFYGSLDPNTLTNSQFETNYGYVPVYGDLFINTSSGSNYGRYYMYSYAPGGDEWTAVFSLQTAANELFAAGNYTWSASAVPNIDVISASSVSASATLWNNVTTGSINIGNGLTTGTLRLATGGTSVTQIVIGHTNSLISLIGNTSITGTLSATALAGGLLSSATPIMDGAGAAGSSAIPSRQDHVHPSDTTKAPLASPALTGTPTAPTAASGTNTTQIATTAFVKTEINTVAAAQVDVPVGAFFLMV